MKFSNSVAGRILWMSTGLFLLGTGFAAVLGGSKAAVVLTVLAPLVAIIGGFVSVGLAINEHPMQALATTVLGPIVLWPAFMLTLVMKVAAPRTGLVLVAVGVACLAAAVMFTLARTRRMVPMDLRAHGA